MKNNETLKPVEIRRFHLGFCLGEKASSLTQGGNGPMQEATGIYFP